MKGPNAWLALQYRISVNIIQFHITYAIFYSILFHSILFYSIPFHSIPFHSIPFHSILFYSIPFHSIVFYSIPFHSILFYSILSYSIFSIKLQVQSHLKKTCFNMYLHTKRNLKVCLWCCICVHENVNVTRITCKPRVLYSGCWFGTSSKHVASHIVWSLQFPQKPTPCPVHLYNLCYTGRKGHYNIFRGIVFSIQLWHEGI